MATSKNVGEGWKKMVDLILIAFYHLTRVGWYTCNQKWDDEKKMVQFRLKDVTFFKQDKQGRLYKLNWKAMAEKIMTADSCTLVRILLLRTRYITYSASEPLLVMKRDIEIRFGGYPADSPSSPGPPSPFGPASASPITITMPAVAIEQHPGAAARLLTSLLIWVSVCLSTISWCSSSTQLSPEMQHLRRYKTHLLPLASIRPFPCWRITSWLHHTIFRTMWSQPNRPSSAPAISYDDIDPYHDPAGSPTDLGVANNTNGADPASDDNGGNGWIFTHSSIFDQLDDHHLLQPFLLRSNTSICDGWCWYCNNWRVKNGQITLFPRQMHQSSYLPSGP